MEIDFINDNMKIEPVNLGLKPHNFRAMRETLHLGELRRLMKQILISVIVLIIAVAIK